MSLWAKYGATAVLLFGAVSVAAAEEPFVDTRVMVRHAGQIFPDVSPYEAALAGKTTFLYRRESLAAYEPSFSHVADAPKPVALMAGVAESSTAVLATRMRVAGDGWAVGAAAREEQGHAYRDGAGTKLNFGYQRESEWLGGRFGKAEDTQVTVGVVRDVLEGSKLLNYGLDVDYLEQGGGRIAAETRRLPGWFNHAGVGAAGYTGHVDVNNYTLRRPGAARIYANGEHRGLRANGWAAHDENGSRTLFGGEVARSTHKARRYGENYGPDVLTSYWVPGVEVVRASTWAEHSRTLGDTRVQGGLRYDVVSMSAANVHDRPNAPVAIFATTPQELYDRYYGANRDNDALDHNISGRVRAEHDIAAGAVGFVDLARMVRSPDHTERYNANGGPAALSEVGNPMLVPEKHYKAELGGSVAGGGYKGYGRASGTGAWRIEGKTWHDRVDDFVAIDMARAQPGVVAAGGGQVYRNVDVALSGVGADLQAMLAEHLAVRLNLSGQRGRNLTDDRPLHQMAPFEAVLFVDTYGGDDDFGWNLGSRLRAVAAKRAVDANPATGSGMDTAGPAGGFATLDLYGGVNFGDTLAVTLGIDNVFDKLYREHLKTTPNNSTGVMPNAAGRTFIMRALLAF